jgi:glycosyltransferase involved in cell wall biosynthesis
MGKTSDFAQNSGESKSGHKLRSRKIIIISPNGLSDAGGVERVMLYAYRALSEHGFQVGIIEQKALAKSRIGQFFSIFKRRVLGFLGQSFGLSIIANRERRSGAFIINNGYAAFFARSDILFCHGCVRAARLAQHRVRFEQRRLDLSKLQEHFDNTEIPRPIRLIERLKLSLYGPDEIAEMIAGHHARIIVAVSEHSRRDWQRYYHLSSGKFEHLPNTVDTKHFHPTSELKEQESSKQSKRVLRILFVGSLTYLKGLDRLRTTVEMAQETGKNWEFIIATPSSFNTEKFASKQNVTIRKSMSFAELPNLYRSCDLLYFPSIYEGFEMVTLEALSSGLPVVGTDVGAISVLYKAGFPGVYRIDPDDFDQISDDFEIAASRWKDPAEKQLLHNLVDANYGISIWSQKLIEIVEACYE